MKREIRDQILRRATRAPSSDNSQPFRYSWQGERLRIFHDEDRARRRGNNANCASLIAFGCLLESLEIAASAEGLVVRMDVKAAPPEADPLWAEAVFLTATAPPDELVPGLEIRASDRRMFQGGSLSEPVFEKLAAEAADFSGCGLYFQDKPGDDLIDHIRRSDDFLWQDPYALKDVLRWVRWSDAEARQTRDGISWRNMAVGYLQSRLMKLVYWSDRFRSFLRRSGGPMRSQRQVGLAQIRSSAALGCITVHEPALISLVEAGRLFLRAWLRLNLAGYGLQVMANPSLHVFQHEVGVLPQDYPAAAREAFAQGRPILQKSFGFPADEVPAWMFRTGRSPSLPAAWRTYRLPLAADALDA